MTVYPGTFYTKVRVLCWVMTGPEYHWSKARHVKQTWGRRCNIIIFISSEEGRKVHRERRSILFDLYIISLR